MKRERWIKLKILVEGFAYILLMALILYLSLQFIVANKQIENAQSYYNDVETDLQINNFSEAKMIELSNNAAGNNYDLSFTDCGEVYRVELKYKLNLSLVGVEPQDRISGYVWKN